MAHSRSWSLLVIFAVVVAGCSSVLPQTTPTETKTAAPVPPPRPTPTPVPSLAPGLTGTGVQDADTLLQAHNAVLANTSYTLYSVETQVYANGTVRTNESATTSRDTTRDRVHRVIDAASGHRNTRTRNATHIEVYREHDRLYLAETNATGTYYHLNGDWRDPSPEISEWVFWLLSGADTRVVGQVRTGDTKQYRIELETITDQTTRGHIQTSEPYTAIRNITFDARIDGRGFIHTYNLTFTKVVSNTTAIHVTRRGRYRSLGTTTVDRPGWFDAAVANTTRYEEG